MRERTKFLWIAAVFLAARFLPLDHTRVRGGLLEAFAMLHEYARDHVLLCLVPAFFIAGAISVFVSQASVMKYLGARASKWVAYPVAAVSGTILAVCSCTVLPLFAGIHKRGAGLGPATAFLYSGPAINVLAIILTGRVLGLEIGIARALGAILFAVVIGLLMHLIFRHEDRDRAAVTHAPALAAPGRTLWQEGVYFAGMLGVLIFANWGKPTDGDGVLWAAVFDGKWLISAVFLAALLLAIVRWFQREELRKWLDATWGFAKQILPLLLGGVLVAGFLLGRPGHEAMIPSHWVEQLVGDNSVFANFFASVSGALMYFATLTEVPILQGLMGAGMAKGPALALLLAGPALSLPNMLVIRSVLGTRKTLTYVVLVVVLSTVAGLFYGSM